MSDSFWLVCGKGMMESKLVVYICLIGYGTPNFCELWGPLISGRSSFPVKHFNKRL